MTTRSRTQPRERCSLCGATLASLERLQEAAWQAIRGRQLYSSGSQHSHPAYCMRPVGYEDGGTGQGALLLLASQLAHRTGRCRDEVICPGSFDDVGDPNENPTFNCQVCQYEIEVDADGRLCVHPMTVAE